jgi:hypothetical protein
MGRVGHASPAAWSEPSANDPTKKTISFSRPLRMLVSFFVANK